MINEYTPIKDKIQLGIWPSGSLVGMGIAPYIRRLGFNKANIYAPNDINLEDSISLFRNDPKGKIDRIFVGGDTPDDQMNRLRSLNKTHYDSDNKIFFKDPAPEDQIHVLILSHPFDRATLDNISRVEPGGIICGGCFNNVREQLFKFKSDYKIRDHLMISVDCWMWYK